LTGVRRLQKSPFAIDLVAEDQRISEETLDVFLFSKFCCSFLESCGAKQEPDE